MNLQPLSETTYVRAWHWGMAIVGVPGALASEIESGRVIAVGDRAITLSVRHAQDIDADRFEGDWDWATTSFTVRSLATYERPVREVLCDVVIEAADERISIGDADGEITLPTPTAQVRVVISTDAIHEPGLETVWIDLFPAGD